MARGGGTGSRTNKKKKTDVSTKRLKKIGEFRKKMDLRDHRTAPQSLLAAGLSRPPRPTEEEMAIR